MGFGTTVDLTYGAPKKTGTIKYRPLETRGVTPNGAVFYYARNGATALLANRLVQAKAPQGTTQSVGLTPSTAIGDWTAAAGITTGKRNIGVVWATAHSSGEYTDGYLTVETTPGSGMYRISADADGGNSATATIITLHPDDPLQVATLTTVSKLALTHNPYSSVIVSIASTQTNLIVGVTPVPVAIGEYFWLQTYGLCAVVYDSAVAVVAGKKVVGGVGTTAGEVQGAAITSATALTQANAPTIGYFTSAIPTAGDLIQMMLTIRA